MPFVYALAAVAATSASVAAIFGGGSAVAVGLWVLAAVTLIGVIIATVVWLVPLNNRIASGKDDAGNLDDVRQESDGSSALFSDLSHWDRLHRYRTIVLAGVVVVEIGAALT